jgi:hypothetical protein
LRLSRNYIGLITIGILVILLVGYNLTNSSSDNSNYNLNDYKVTTVNQSTSTFSGYNLSFNFPSNWDVNTDNDNGLIITITPEQSNSDNDPFLEVIVAPNPKDMTDQEAVDAALDTSSYPNSWHQISNKTLSIDNNTAYENTFTVDDKTDFSENMTLEQINIVKNGTTYTFMLQAPVNDFNNEQTNFNIMINSIKIN